MNYRILFVIFLILGGLAACSNPLTAPSQAPTVPQKTLAEFISEANLRVLDDNYYLLEGDIVVSKSKVMDAYNRSNNPSQARGNILYDGRAYKWDITEQYDMSYSFNSDMTIITPNATYSDAEVRQAFREAAAQWCQVADINMYEVPSGGRIDVKCLYVPSFSNIYAMTMPPPENYLNINTAAFDRIQDTRGNGGPINKIYSLPEIKSIILHEIGHSLLLAHEQTRADTPFANRTYDDFGTKPYGSYDPYSIMNYANQASLSGILSSGDKDTIQYLYGKPYQYFVTDINGDGLNEFVRARKSGANQAAIIESNRLIQVSNFQNSFFYSAFSNPEYRWLRWQRVSRGNWSIDGTRFWFTPSQRAGQADFLCLNENGDLNMSPSEGGAFNNIAWTIPGNDVNANQYYFADVNGDGISEQIAINQNGTYSVKLNAGTGTRWYLPALVLDTSPGNKFYFADVNGDLKADLITIKKDGSIAVALSDGNGFGWLKVSSSFSRLRPYITRQWSWTSNGSFVGNKTQFTFADVNWDNCADLVAFDDNGFVYLSLSNGLSFNTWDWTSGNQWVPKNATNIVADINNDGLPDLISIEPHSQFIVRLGARSYLWKQSDYLFGKQ